MRLILLIATLLCLAYKPALAVVDFKVRKSNMPAVLKAKKISGDQINGDLIASGNVEIAKDSSTIYADEVKYNKNTKTIEGFGNEVIIKNLEVGKVLTPKFNIKDDFSGGNFFNARMYFVDGSYMFANKISRLAGDKTQLHDSFFSICPNEDIVKDNNKAGKIFDFAAISSKSLMIDRQTQDISTWNAVVKIYNLPVIYFPYLKFPLPSSKRKSGILRPSYVRNTNLGLGITVPVYIDLGANKDLTVTPSYFIGSNQVVLKNEWRHIVKNGQYKLNIELANNKIRNTIDRNVVNRTKKATRWSLQGEGDFDFDLNYGMDFKLRNVSDRNYSRDYGLDYSAYNLSKINFDYIKNRTYYGVQTMYFQELEFEAKERSAPKILPAISTHNETKSLFLKEKFMLDTNTVVLSRNDGLQYKRMSMIPNFKIPFNISGNLFELSSKLQNDLYFLNDKDLQKDQVKLYNSFQRDLKTEFSASWSLPMLKKNKNSSITVEPIANFVMSQYQAKNNLIPLEDGLNGELTFSNLFVNDRISGFDRNESGKRVSYGLRSSFFNSYGEFNFTSGQALLIKRDEQDVKIRGFATNNKSNIVGILGFKGKKYFAISYAFQLDQSDYRNEINQINTNFNYKKYALDVDYLLIRRNSVNLSAREQINFSNTLKLPYNLNLRFNVVRDLKLKRNIVRGVEIRRNGCCTDFSFSVIENNPSSLSKPQKNFKMEFSFKNL